MKKIYALIIATGLVLSANSALATGLASDSVDVTATVAEYAAITEVGSIDLQFDGSATQNLVKSTTIDVESNCNVAVAISGGNLTLVGGTDTITTTYKIDNNELQTTHNQSMGNSPHTITADASTAAISTQAAGDYAATVTVTVSSTDAS